LHFESVGEYKENGEQFNYLYLDGEWLVSEDNYETKSDWKFVKDLLQKEIA